MNVKICLSPAKGFQEAISQNMTSCLFLDKAKALVEVLKGYSEEELKALFQVSDKIAAENALRFQTFSFEEGLRPAVETFDGMAFRAMDFASMEEKSREYVRRNVVVFSGLYGYLRATDGVRAYRLDLKDKVCANGALDLYHYWGEDMAEALKNDADGLIINLASKEYFRAVAPYIKNEKVVTCTFLVEKSGKKKNLSPWAKKGRGLMVRYMAENCVTDYRILKDFQAEGFVFEGENCSKNGKHVEYVFVRQDV